MWTTRCRHAGVLDNFSMSISSNLEIGALSIFAIVVFLRLLGFRDLSFSF